MKTPSTADRLEAGSPCIQISTWTGTARLADELHLAECRRRLRSAASSSLIVNHTRLSIVDDRTFPVAAARTWNSLLQHISLESSSEDLTLLTVLQMIVN